MIARKGLFAGVGAGLLLCCLALFGGMAVATAAESASQSSQSQKITIKGTVIDSSTKESIAGANVWLKDSSIGVITDADGNFVLTVPDGFGVLQASFLGYKDASLEIRNRSVLNFALEPDSEMMEETIVVGYGVQRRESVVGAIDAVQGEHLKLPVAKISTILSGQLAGVVTVQRSGEPGSAANFYIRGVSTFNQSGASSVLSLNTPLVLVDGIEREMDLVDPEDIESLSVLKDAAATAIYGVRGANGVIIIKTRSGATGKAKVSVRAESGVTTPTQMPVMADAVEWCTLFNEASGYNGKAPTYSPEDIQMYADGSDPDLYPNVNWIDSLFKDYASNQRVNVNVSGGGSIARYYVSGSFYNEGSIYRTDDMNDYNTAINYNKFNFRSNIDINLSPSTILNVNLSNIYETKVSPAGSGIWARSFYTSPNAYPVVYSDGTLSGEFDGAGNNPYNLLVHSGFKNQYWNNAQSLIGLTHDFSDMITPGLKANIKFSWDQYTNQTQTYSGQAATFIATGRDGEGNLIYETRDKGSQTLSYSTSSSANKTFYLEGSITYDRVFADKHRVGALFLYNQKSKRYQLASDSDSSLPYRHQGIAGRATYSYDDRYFAEFNFGYNGSENFSPGHRFGFFPSFALGYMISNEPWWGDMSKVINVLKFKGSYGEVGNDNISGSRRFIYDDIFTTASGIYHFGSSNNSVNSIYLREVGNKTVSWERATKINLGLEVEFFRALKIQADYFTEARDGIFLHREDISALYGMASNPYANVGEAVSRGIDTQAEFHKRWGDFTMSFRGTFEYARSEVVNDAKPAWNYAYRELKGRPINQLTGLIAEGLFTSQEEIDNSPKQQFGPVRVGDIKYRDLNGDGIINKYDQTSIGRTTLPEIMYSFTPSFQWRNWDFSALFSGVANVTIELSGEALRPFTREKYFISGFYKYVYDNCWKLDNQDPNAEFPRNDVMANSNNNQNSTYWQRDGSFLRLKNATLGYTIPRKVTSRLHVDGCRVYAQGVNLLTFSKFKLFDPELGSGQGAGYPPNRYISVGLNLNF